MTVMVVTARNLIRVAVELLNVVMDTVMVMKLKHHVQRIVQVEVVKVVKIVNLILLLMDQNAAIVPGMNLA